jgi:dihydrofolate synthase/folylpolyglutamate synthase
VSLPITYDDALAQLSRALVFGINPSLDGVTALCAELGDPQDAFESVQITGTNGKSSTARATASLLRGEGIATGLYTSPELERYPERIEIGGEVVSDDDFALALGAALGAAQELRGDDSVGTAAGFTEFELLTAAALWLFRERDVEVAVLEVGLGGRWDATSVVSPSVAAITGVGLDHMAILGDTLEAIAAEKAAIIRTGTTPVLGPGTAGVERAFLARAEALGTAARAVRAVGDPTPVADARTVRYAIAARPSAPDGATVVDVFGIHASYPSLAVSAPSYQAANIATAIAIAEAALGRALEVEAARGALSTLTFPGRFELVCAEPPVIVDGSHNPQAAAVLAAALHEAFPAGKPDLLLGVLADKDARGIVAALAPEAGTISVTQPESPRALSAEGLAAIVEQVTGQPPVASYGTIAEALSAMLTPATHGLVTTGSLTTAGQARRLLRETL